MYRAHVAAPRIDQINVVVGDVAAAAQFLADLGVDLPAVPAGWDAHHRSVPTATPLHAGDDPLEPVFGIDLDSSAFAHQWGGLPPSFTGVVLDLRVDERSDVDSVHEVAISIGGQSLRSPYDAFWGARFALVEGPGPIAIGIMSVPDASHRSAPPDPGSFS